MDAAASGDWRSQLQPEARVRNVNKIIDALKRQFLVGAPENWDELRKIAVRFEEKTFTTAINQADYLKRISTKMLTMESRPQNPGITNQMPSNPGNQNPPDPDSMDSTSQTGQVVSDWQEEAYRKIQSMKELYNAEVAELHQKISLKCQQHDALMPPGSHSEQLENMKKLKFFWYHVLLLFQLSKSNITPTIKEKLPLLEKKLMGCIARNNALQRQGQQQFPHPAGDAQSMLQLPSSRVSSIHQHDNHGNQRISMKMLTMESRPQNPGITNQMPSNPANQNPPDPDSNHEGVVQCRGCRITSEDLAQVPTA